jgi:hypothetical protein
MSSAGRTIQMIRTLQGFMPWGDEDREQLQRIKVGQVCRVVVKVIRNWKFHRKVFSLFQFAYDQWEPGCDAQFKSPERFRKDLTILAGHYTRTVSLIDGKIRLEAVSLSFGSMGEQEFEQVYADLKRVVWKHVIENKGSYTEAEFENVLAQLLEYDA